MPSKLATKDDLHEMYNRMLPYMGGMPEALANKFSKSDLHYTTEKIVGRWIDGRPLYSLTIDESVVSSSSEIDTNLCALPANINEVVSITGVAFDITNAYAIFTCPYYASSSSYCGFRVSKTKDYLKVKFRGLTPSGTPTDTVGFYATIQYTKTTDAANSFKFADETDFSTSEKIIGTWLDGSYIYQKTISTGQLPSTGSKSTAHNISNLKYIVDYFGVAKRSTDNTFISLVFTNPDTVASQVALTVNSTNIVISTGMDRSNFTESYVTIRYIKTS